MSGYPIATTQEAPNWTGRRVGFTPDGAALKATLPHSIYEPALPDYWSGGSGGKPAIYWCINVRQSPGLRLPIDDWRPDPDPDTPPNYDWTYGTFDSWGVWDEIGIIDPSWESDQLPDLDELPAPGTLQDEVDTGLFTRMEQLGPGPQDQTNREWIDDFPGPLDALEGQWDDLDGSYWAQAPWPIPPCTEKPRIRVSMRAPDVIASTAGLLQGLELRYVSEEETQTGVTKSTGGEQFIPFPQKFWSGLLPSINVTVSGEESRNISARVTEDGFYIQGGPIGAEISWRATGNT